MANVIIQRITIEGGKEVEAALNSIGKSGEDAFKRVQNAASGVSSANGLKNLTADAVTAGSAVSGAANKTRNLRDVMDVLGATSAEAGKNIKGMSRSAADGAAGLGSFGDAGDQAGVAIGATDVAAIRFGQSLRLIGRAARIPELSQLGRTIGVLGRAFEIAAPALFIAFLEKLASSAAKAADTVADLAAKNKVSLADFQDFSSAFGGIGQGAEDAGKGFHSLTEVIKETANNTKQNEQNFKRLGDELAAARDKADTLSQGFIKIDREAFRALRDIRQEQEKLARETIDSERDFEQSLAKILQSRSDIQNGPPSAAEKRRRELSALDEQEDKLRRKRDEDTIKRGEEQIKLQEKEADAIRKKQEESQKLIAQQVAEEEKIRNTQKALADARAEADRNATALEKLGIKATDATGKLAKAPAVMLDIARALEGISNADQRTAVENDLVAAGLDRKLLPALRRGVAGFQELQAVGKRISGPFSQKDIDVADAFQIAVGQAGLALAALKNAFGLAVAPAFTAFFERMRDLFIELQPAIAEFGSLIGSALKPILEGLATTLKVVVQAFGALFQLVADSINKVFGTNITPVQVFAAVIGGLIIAFGGLPAAIVLAAAAVGKLIDTINNANLDPIVKTAIKAALAVGAALLLIVPIAISVVGGIVTAFIPIGRVFGAGIATVTSFGSALSAFGTLVGRVLGAAVPFVTRFIGAIGGIAGIIIRAGIAVVGFIASVASIPAIIAIVVAAAIGFFAVWAFQNWDAITKFAQDTWQKIKDGAQSLWDAVTQFFSDGVDAIVNFFTVTIPEAAQGAWQVFQDGVSAAWEFVTQAFNDGVAAITVFFTQTIPQAAQAGWDLVVTGAQDLWDKVTGFFQAGVDKVVGFLGRLKDFAVSVWNAITGAAKEAADAQGEATDAGGGAGFARGGPVWGRGTSTSDSIPAWLSTGEFVQPTRAVRHYGLAFMEALRQLRVPKDFMKGLSLGGLADRISVTMPSLPMHFASGGPVPTTGGMRPVTIHFGDQVITGLRATDEAVSTLTKASVRRQVRSAGRLPGYFGRGK